MTGLIPKGVKVEAAHRDCFATIELSGSVVTIGIAPLEAPGPLVRRTFRRGEYDAGPEQCWRSILAEHDALRGR